MIRILGDLISLKSPQNGHTAEWLELSTELLTQMIVMGLYKK